MLKRGAHLVGDALDVAIADLLVPDLKGLAANAVQDGQESRLEGVLEHLSPPPGPLRARAVAVGNPREFTQAEKEEQEIAEVCNRLIKNSIICWNYLYLAHQLEKAPDEETRENLRRTVTAHAPMAWAHINMLGEYDFSEHKLRDALGILPLKSAA